MSKIVNQIDLTKYYNLRFMTAISLMYYGFLRISELTNLKYNDISIEENGITLNIRISKNDPFGKGCICYIQNSNTPYSPHILLNRLKQFPNFKSKTYPFKYNISNFNSKLRILLDLINIKDTQNYSSHSFRRGGTTEAARAGIQDNVIKQHGRWKSTIFMLYTSIERKEAGKIITNLI